MDLKLGNRPWPMAAFWKARSIFNHSTMTRHTLDAPSMRLLKRLVGCRADQLVLDINAVYVVGPGETIKVEALAVVPESPEPGHVDEVFPINVVVARGVGQFDRFGEEGFAYRVAAENVNVRGVEIVRVAVRFPRDETIRASTADEHASGVNVVDCGVLMRTDQGVLVAYQRHPGFGFHWGKHGFGQLLSTDVAMGLVDLPYELVPIA
jgi:hypothetical protein